MSSDALELDPREHRGRLDPGGQGVLERLIREVSLCLVLQQEADQLDSFVLAVGVLDHRRAGDDHQAADVVIREVVVDAGELGIIGQCLVEVVVVDEADVDLAAADGCHDRVVVREREGVVVGDAL